MDLYKSIYDNIQQTGWHLMGVGACHPGEEGFIYTIGNHLRGLPELLLIGSFDMQITGHALNELSAKMREEGKPLPEGFVDIGWSYPFKVRKAGPVAKTKYTIQAGRYFQHEQYEVLQVMICDPKGLYPGDAGIVDYFDVEQP